MSFYKPEECKECHRKKYPLNCWQNYLKVDWVLLAITIAIILMIVGFKQTLGQCKELLTDPCPKLHTVCCTNQIQPINIPTSQSNGYAINVTPENIRP